jgi:glyoxylase-like metal-dependent hydrolase (beta-lactamase superfamily II)
VIVPSSVIEDVWVLSSTQAAPGHGVLPVNAFLLREDPPILIDTGLAAERDGFLDVLWSLVRPSELAMVFVTHEDADHAGNLGAVLDAAPQARLVTNYVTLSKLLERTTAPLERVQVVNPGSRLPDTPRPVTVLRPPVYDAPGTVGLYDAASGAAFTADAFGTYLREAVDDVRDVPEDDLLAGLMTFNSVNHPWTTLVDRDRFDAIIGAVADLEPTVLLSSHALPAGQATALLIEGLRRGAPTAVYVAPDQDEFDRLRPQLDGSSRPGEGQSADGPADSAA